MLSPGRLSGATGTIASPARHPDRSIASGTGRTLPGRPQDTTDRDPQGLPATPPSPRVCHNPVAFEHYGPGLAFYLSGGGPATSMVGRQRPTMALRNLRGTRADTTRRSSPLLNATNPLLPGPPGPHDADTPPAYPSPHTETSDIFGYKKFREALSALQFLVD